MLAKLRRTFSLLLMLFGIPGFGLGAAYILGFGLGAFTIALMLAGVSILAGIAGLALLLFVWFAALFCGQRRERLVVVFRHLVRLVALALAVLVLIQGAIAVTSLALLENGFLHVISIGLLIPIVLGALYGAWEIVLAAFEAVRPLETIIVGIQVSEATQPRLWQRIRAVATQLGARLPDHVVVGLQPTFFASASGVRLEGTKTRLTGETLYLSAPLMRVVSEDEFNAVVGHELAHFLGADTAYSLRFVPVYQGLTEAMAATDQGGRSHNLALQPARAVLGFTLSRFGQAERSINRKREIEADRIGAGVAGGRAMVTALVKVAMADPAWGRVLKSSIVAINQREIVENMSQAFVASKQHLLSDIPAEKLLAGIEGSHQPHPTDSHPTLAVRAAALGVALDETLVSVAADAPSAIGLVDEHEALELSLTQLYADALIARGLAKPASTIGRRTAFQMKRDTLAKRAAARKQALAADGEEKQVEA